MISRRNLLKSAGGILVAAPFVCSASSLMKIKEEPVRCRWLVGSHSWDQGLITFETYLKMSNPAGRVDGVLYFRPVYNSLEKGREPMQLKNVHIVEREDHLTPALSVGLNKNIIRIVKE